MDLGIDDLKAGFDQLILQFRRFQFGTKAQLAFLEDFYLLINDGIPANRAIEMMAQVSQGVSREVALSIADKISQGQPLAEGMRVWFSPNAVEIIRVGEEGGALVQTVKSAVNTMSQKKGTVGALISAMAYPLMVITIACGIMVYLNNSVFIQFQAIKPMDQWPEAGRRFVAFSNVIQEWWWLVIILVIMLILIFRYLMANYIGDLRPSLDKIPPFNLYRRFAAARVLETLGLLVANGVVFKSALRVMQYQTNPYIGSHLVMMEHLLAMGKGNIADVLSTGLVNEKDILRLRVMAEVKGFEHGLIRMGIHGQEENLKIMKLIAKIIGGTLLVIGGLLIIIVVQGIYLTGMSMGQ
jgi:general secretion pathway protein F